MTDQPADTTIEYAEELDNELLSEFQQLSPEDWAGPLCVQRSDAAQMQEFNGTNMTATFLVATRDDNTPNRADRLVQLAAGPAGKGLDTTYYAKAPVVLFDHGLSGLTIPVGMCERDDGALDMMITPQQAIATVHFSDLPHAAAIMAAVEAKLLRMASIGFNIRKVMRVATKRQAMPAGVENLVPTDVYDVVESELLEWSITAIGADRGALRQCLERGRIGETRLPAYLRQSFAGLAEGRKAWSPGFSSQTYCGAYGGTTTPPVYYTEAERTRITQLEAERTAITSQARQRGYAEAPSQSTASQAAKPPVTQDEAKAIFAAELSRQQRIAAQVKLTEAVVQAAIAPIRAIGQEIVAAHQSLRDMTGKLS